MKIQGLWQELFNRLERCQSRDRLSLENVARNYLDQIGNQHDPVKAVDRYLKYKKEAP